MDKGYDQNWVLGDHRQRAGPLASAP